ncbi:MAG: divergent polysaccharide deacetylase family protein [Treponema sp.]|nr:divergent polysaccharide deacetylase family protein [Treponema sp.]
MKRFTANDRIRAILVVALFISLSLCIFAGILLIRSFTISPPEPAVLDTSKELAPTGGTMEQPPEPILIFVIDDAGNNLWELEPFLRFPGPLSIAVLPGLPYSAEAAERIRAAGKELLLHQPMEAIGGEYPGPGAIYEGMDQEEIRTIMERNLAEIGPVAGINNHQGSKITQDGTAMETILALCREHGIYFLDSRTTADTAAPAVAKRMGIKIGERDVFLDNIQEKAAMIGYVQEGLQKAEQKGFAIMIGHTWSTELAATLEELYPELIEQGYSLSTIARLMMDHSW